MTYSAPSNFLIGCISLSIVLLCPVVILLAQTNEDLFEQGNQMLQEGRYSEAVDQFRRYRVQQPSDPRSYFYSAMALVEMSDLTAASSELIEAVRLDPDKPEYRILQANVLARLRHKTLALQSLQPLEQDDAAGDITDAWKWLLSDTYYRLEKNDEALQVLETLRQIHPEDPRVFLNRGQALRAKGDFEAALQSLERSIELAPENNAAAYFQLGEVQRQLNQKREALKAYRQAVEQNPAEREYQFRLGMQHLDAGNIDEAIHWLQKAAPEGERIPEIYYGLGRAYRAAGDTENSQKYLKLFQQQNTTQRERDDRERQAAQKINQGEQALDEGRVKDALSHFQEAATIDPQNWDAHGYLAEVYLTAGQTGAALPHLKKIQQLDPESPVGNYLLADYWFQEEHYQTALKFAKKVRKVRPANARLRNLLGNIYLQLGRKEEARKEYRAAVELAPKRSDFRANLEVVEKR